MAACKNCGVDIPFGQDACPGCGNTQRMNTLGGTSTENPLIGKVIAQNFRITQLLGLGAMGKVYKAEQISLGKLVAIKVLHKHLAHDESLARRFHREARAASALNHPNSIQVIDFGQSQDGELFIAMEYLQGSDLARLIREEYPLTLHRIVRIMCQVCSALDEAHSNNIIHRDLKPENIMIVPRRDEPDYVKVCDFGIAKVQDPKSDNPEASITMAGVVCGTPEYMSPEQARGEKLDARSDLYSAGVILYQMIVGDVPFRAESALGVVTKHLTESPVPPSKRRPEMKIDVRLESLIMRTLSKGREGRPLTAVDLKRELEGLIGEGSGLFSVPPKGGSRPSMPGVAVVPPTSGTLMSGEMVAQPARRRTGLISGLVALTLLLVGGSVWFFGFRTTGADTPGPKIAAVNPAGNPPPGTGTAPVGDPKGAVIPPVVKVDAGVAPGVADAGTVAVKPAVDAGTPVPLAVDPPPVVAPPVKVSPKAKDPKAAKGRAKALAEARKSEKAEEKKTALPPPALSGFEALMKEAADDFRQGRYTQAITKYESARTMRPGHAVVYRELGKSYMRTRNVDRGVKSFKRYLELAPNASDADIYRGIIQSQ